MSDHVDEPRRRLTLSQTVEQLIAALARTAGEHSTVKLTRNARGDTQIEVSVRTGEGSIETVDEASSKARAIYDELAVLYPIRGTDA